MGTDVQRAAIIKDIRSRQFTPEQIAEKYKADLHKVRQLFDKAGIPYTVEHDPENDWENDIQKKFLGLDYKI